ncbi:MAG: hypothetical protein RR690_01705 [Longicatena sp.]
MKKIMLYCLPMAVFILLMICVAFIPSNLDFEFKTIKGNISDLKDVEFNVEFINSIGYSDTNITVIQVKNKEGKVSHTMEYNKDLYQDFRSGESISTNLNPGNIVAARSSDGECKVEKILEKNPVPIIYTVHDMIDENGKTLEIETDMSYLTGDQHSIYKYKVSCNDGYFEEGYESDYKDGDEDQTTYDKLEKANENLYYFLPTTNSLMSGKNHIYKISMEDKSTTTNSYQVKAKVSDFVELPEGRYYDRLLQTKDRIFVASHIEDKYYLMQYDKEGNFINELAYDIKLDVSYLKSNDTFLLTQTLDKVYVIDQNTLEVIDTYTIPKDKEGNSSYISDMIYKNKTLYLLIGIEASLANKDGSSYYETIGYEVQTVKEGKVRYRGVLNLYDADDYNSSNLFNIYPNSASFKRNES